MRPAKPHSFTLLFAFTAATLTACGGSSVTPTASTAIRPVTQVQPAKKKKKTTLLYVSDVGTDNVYVYTYPDGTLSQTLTGFGSPTGLCTDKKGDVYVTDQYNNDIVEYAHGGSSPIDTIYEENHNPGGCSVNPKNGDLAVANVGNAGTSGEGPATVAVFTKSSRSHTYTLYSDAGFLNFFFCGYDKNGNLFVDGMSNPSTTGLAELPNGSSSFTNLKTNQSLYGPAGVQFDGKYIAVSDEQSTIYQFSISGNKATKAGSTSLKGASSVYEFWVDGKRVAGANGGNGTAGIWKYPDGGSALQTIKGLNAPYGIVISTGK